MTMISEDRRAIAKAIMLEMQCHDFGTRLDSGDFRCSSAQIDLLEACCNAAADRVIALQPPPSGEAGEPVAWRARWSGDAGWHLSHAPRLIRGDDAEEYIQEPLYTRPTALPTIKEPTDGK
jgi:hypothetical protein